MKFLIVRVFAVVSAFVLFVLPALAQGIGAGRAQPMTPAQQRQRMEAANEVLYKKLGLTTAQRAKMQQMTARYEKMAMTRVKAIQKKYTLGGQQPTQAQQIAAQRELVQFIVPLQKQASKEVMAMLTPKQQKIYRPIAEGTAAYLSSAQKSGTAVQPR